MKFKKKPVVIEAFQMTKENQVNENCEWPVWLVKAWTKNHGEAGSFYSTETVKGLFLYLTTLEGPINISLDDWIIQGEEGELYPCKPEIFALTYDRVE